MTEKIRHCDRKELKGKCSLYANANLQDCIDCNRALQKPMTENIKDIESALQKVKDQKENFGFMERFTVDENWEVTKALDKQIPKKPEYIGDGYSDGQLVYDTFICPSCGTHYEVDYDDYMYCPKCGQRLDLTEVAKYYDSGASKGNS